MNSGHDGSGDGCARGIGFQAAKIAATANTPSGMNGDMTNLTRCATQTGIESTVLHNAGTNAGANEDTDKVIIAPPGTIEIFAEGGNLDIVAHRDGPAKLLAEDSTHRHIPDTQVGRVQDYSGLAVDLACRADADGNDIGGREFRIVDCRRR